MILRSCRSSHILATPMRGILILAAVVCLIASTASTQTTTQPGAAEAQPDVQVLVLHLDKTGLANVAVTYTGVEPLEAAQKDLDEIGRRTGWKIGNPTMSNSEATDRLRPAMSSVEFIVPNAIAVSPSPLAGGLPIEPLIAALKRFKEIELVFAMRPEFRFRGLTNFENDHVRIRLRKGGQTYSYRALVKRSDFQTLGLPTIVQQKPAVPRTSGSKGLLWPLVIAVGIAAVVWLLAQTAKKRKA